LGGIPILPAYCPLCNTAVVFDRRLTVGTETYTLEFEVSGMLRKSNLILYDFLTESWWQHLTGESMVGEFAGRELTLIPSLIISYKEFFDQYPDGKILSPKTGSKYEKQYGTIPYEKYDDPESKPYERFFNSKEISTKLKPMERVVNIEHSGKRKIYPYSIISEKKIINDSHNGLDIVIFYESGTVSVLDNVIVKDSRDIGSVTVFNPTVDNKRLTFARADSLIIDTGSNSEWTVTGKCIKGPLKGKQLEPIVHGHHFAFAWLSFYPESIIYLED
jgi:hypothetical protein